jgi:hypothetical protein
MLSDLPNYTIRHAQQHPSSNRSGMYAIGPSQALKAQRSYMKKQLAVLMTPHSCYTAFSLPVCNYGLMGVNRGREDSGLAYSLFPMLCRHHLKVDR